MEDISDLLKPIEDGLLVLNKANGNNFHFPKILVIGSQVCSTSKFFVLRIRNSNIVQLYIFCLIPRHLSISDRKSPPGGAYAFTLSLS